jgi:hypothetical protein
MKTIRRYRRFHPQTQRLDKILADAPASHHQPGVIPL